jgi:hypothetical protein
MLGFAHKGTYHGSNERGLCGQGKAIFEVRTEKGWRRLQGTSRATYSNGLARIGRVNHGEDQPGGFSSMVFDRSNGIYRSVFVAIAGLILAVYCQPISSNTRSQPTAEQGNKDATKDANIAASVSRIGNALEAKNAKTDPYEKDRNKREIRDLQAQEKSAYWAEWMFYATAVAVILSVLGIALVYITFRATRKANDIATFADRPWVGFKPGINGHLQIKQKTLQYDISIPATNYGVRPALAVTGRIKAFLDVREIGDLKVLAKEMFANNEYELHFMTVFPGQIEDIELSGSTSIEGMTNARTQFVIAIQYLDPAMKGVFYSVEAFDMHTNDASSYGREGDVNKLIFHGHGNSTTLVRFDLYKIREITSVVT